MPEEVLFEGLTAAGAEFGVPSAFAAAAPEIGGALTGAALGGAALAEGAAAPAITAETVGALGAGDAVGALGAGDAAGGLGAGDAVGSLSSPLGGGTPVSSTPVAPPIDVTSSIPATDAAAPTAIAPATAEAPVDLTAEEQARTGTTTAGPGGEADPYYQSKTTTSPFKPYTGPTMDDIRKGLQSLGVTPFQAGTLGLNLASQYKSAQNQKSLQQQLEKQAQLTRPASEKLMSQYQSGTIGAAQEKQITDYTNAQKAQIKQRYARMGRDPNYDSAAQQEMANVDVQAASMRDSALQNVLSSGLKAAGVTSGPTQQAIMAGYQEDQAAQKAQADFLKTLAEMQARAGTGTQTTPTAVPLY